MKKLIHSFLLYEHSLFKCAAPSYESFLYSDFPFTSTFIPANTLNSTSVFTVNWSLNQIEGMWKFLKIGSSVIQGVVVDMIRNIAFLTGGHYLRMHPHEFVAFKPMGIKSISLMMPMGAPIPKHKPFVIRNINDSKLLLGKRNIAYGFIRRLCDEFSFRHFLFSNKHASTISFCTKLRQLG